MLFAIIHAMCAVLLRACVRAYVCIENGAGVEGGCFDCVCVCVCEPKFFFACEEVRAKIQILLFADREREKKQRMT